MRALVWFRADLRVADNPALTAAAEMADDGVVGLFVPTPDQWREHGWGDAKTWFVLASAAHLQERLRDLGVPLVVRPADRFDDCPRLVSEVARELGCDAVFASREYEVNETARDRRVEAACEESGLEMHWSEDQCIVPPGELTTGSGSVYVVFTPFRRSWEERIDGRGPGVPPAPPDGLEPVVEPSGRNWLEDLAPEVGSAVTSCWPPGEAEAVRRLERFADTAIESYGESRDEPALDGTSRLSPYLAAGCLSARRCLVEAMAVNDGALSGGAEDIETWISELAWRDFYRHVLVGYPRVGKNRAFRAETEAVEWRTSEEDLEAWRRGRTGVPFVDAGMRQLRESAWMHNRLRMVTAMFLSKDLLLDWRLGEAVFARHLIDLDFASNNGGWQWSASTGTDAAPYFRIFNPWTQGKRFDPEGAFIRRWVPELEEVEPRDLHDPERLKRRIGDGLEYPEPIVAHSAARVRAVEAFEAAKEAASDG